MAICLSQSDRITHGVEVGDRMKNMGPVSIAIKAALCSVTQHRLHRPSIQNKYKTWITVYFFSLVRCNSWVITKAGNK